MRDKIMMLVFVLVLGTILTGILVAVNWYTTPVITKNAEREVQANVLQALGIPWTEDNVEQVFLQKVQSKQQGDTRYYVASGEGIAFAWSGSGLWGPISGIAAVSTDLATIKAVTIIHQEETPGLGGRIAEQPYLDQFGGKELTAALKLVPPGKASQANEIDAITGATLSSKAFVDILNANLAKALPAVREGEKQ